MPSSQDSPTSDVKRRRKGPDWFWKLAGIFGLGQPIVDREKMFGEDPRNDPYQHDFDPDRKDRR